MLISFDEGEFGQALRDKSLLPRVTGATFTKARRQTDVPRVVQDDSALFPDRYLNVNWDTTGMAAVSIM